jgi:hypothetical protein
MFAYGVFGISLALFVGRLFHGSSKNRIFSYYIATIMIIVPILDFCENIISLITLSNPLEFPNVLGIIHSLFALIKWSLGGTALLWVIFSLISRITKKNPNLA